MCYIIKIKSVCKIEITSVVLLLYKYVHSRRKTNDKPIVHLDMECNTKQSYIKLIIQNKNIPFNHMNIIITKCLSTVKGWTTHKSKPIYLNQLLCITLFNWGYSTFTGHRWHQYWDMWKCNLSCHMSLVADLNTLELGRFQYPGFYLFSSTHPYWNYHHYKVWTVKLEEH